MAFLKKRGTAFAVLIASICLSTVLSGRAKLDGLRRDYEQGFFQAENDADRGYYTCPGDQLESCEKYANRMLAITKASPELSGEYEALSAARTELVRAMDSGDISDIYDANEAVKSAMGAMESAAAAGGLSFEGGVDSFDDILADFSSAQELVGRSGYNESLAGFDDTTLSFMRLITSADEPERFE